MFSIVKEWKAFRVFLPDLHTWLADLLPGSFAGLSADSVLTLWFEEQPGYEGEGAIDAYWEDLTEEGEDAKWVVYNAKNAAVAEARTAILTADFDDLIPAERKLFMNMTLTEEDRSALLLKYPQA